MKNKRSLPFLAQSMLAALLLIPSVFADVNGHLIDQSAGINTGGEQLDVRFTQNGEVRIAWNEQSMRHGILQVSSNCVDWTEVPNASSPFFTPLNNEVSTYYRVVYTLSGGNTNPADSVGGDTTGGPEDPEDAGGVIVGTPGDEVAGEPGPDMSWADRNGDGQLDAKDLEGIPGGPDDLMNAINAMQGDEAKSVPVPIEWLEEIIDRLNQSQGEDEPGHRVGIIVSVNPVMDADTFRNRLEHGPGLHDSIHCIVGGTMCSARSSNDPIFFTHHAKLDKIIEGEKQSLLIALVNFPDDLSGIVSTILHDTSMAVIRKMGEINDGDNNSGQDGYPVLIHGIAAADSPIEGFWIAPSVEVSELAGAIASTSLHNNGTFLPWHRGISLHNNGAFLPWHRGISLHNNGAFLPWHRAHITFPDDLGPPGGTLQENRDPVPALITGIWTKSSGNRLADDLDLLLNDLWHDAIPEGDDVNAGDPARLVMLDTGPVNLTSREPEDNAGLDVGPVNLVMKDGAGNAIGRKGAVYIFHRENNDGNLSRRVHDTAMAVIRKIGATPEGGNGGGGGRVVVRATSLQNDPGLDPVQGVVVEIDKSSPKIAHQALSGDEDSGDDIGMVLLEIDKSSPKIAEAILKAGESLAEEHFVVILDTTLTDLDGPVGRPARNPTYAAPEELVLELEINKLIELRELVELHGEEHGLVGEIPFDQILADIDQIIAQGERMHRAGFVHQGSMSLEVFADNISRQRKSLNDASDFQEFFTGESLEEYNYRLERNTGKDLNKDGYIGDPDDGKLADSGEDDDSEEGPENEDDDSEEDIWWDPRWDEIDFGLSVQISLETTSLEGIRTLVDNQLEALEQLNASVGIVEANVENNVELDDVSGGDSGGPLIDVAGGLSVISPENNGESFIKLGDIKGE